MTFSSVPRRRLPSCVTILAVAMALPRPSASSTSNGGNLRGHRAIKIFDEVPSIQTIADEAHGGDWDINSVEESNQDEASNRIIGGNDALPGEYPWVVMGDKEWWGCNAILVHPQFLLTVAHCAREWASYGEKRAYIGAQSYNHANKTSTNFIEERFWMERFFHYDYDSETDRFDNDFALLKLTQPATVTPATVDDGSVDASLSNGADLITLGFGVTQPGDRSTFSTVLQKVVVPYVNHSQCDDIFGPNRISTSMICAGGEAGKDSCIGDSGGPLFKKGENGVSDGVLVGMTSFGRGCAQNGVPAVYARVSAAKPWIDRIVCEHADYPHISCPAELMDRELDTIYEMNVERSRRGSGAMVDVTSTESIKLRTLDLHVYGEGSHTVRVYTKLGSYQGYENITSAWETFCEANIVAQGRGRKTPIPEESCSAIQMAKGENRAFYAVLDKPFLLYSVVDEGGDPIYKSNAHLRIKSDGVGRNSQELLDDFVLQIWKNRLFNGSFRYTIVHGEPQAPAPVREKKTRDRTRTRRKRPLRRKRRVPR